MAKVTQFVSDISGKPLDEKTAVSVTLDSPAFGDSVVTLDVSAEEASVWVAKGAKTAKRGRKPKTAPAPA